MGSKKKKPCNAFSIFLRDYVESEREKGRNISHKIGAEECALKWKELPEEEKENYRKIANDCKMTSKNDKRNKFTSTGISFAQIEKEMKMAREKTEKEDQEIKKTIHQLDYDLLKTQLFYIVHCNYYCKTYEGIYIPGEIAIAEFSLGDGIKKVYHTLINPGDIPLGFAFEAQTNIDEIHKLPFPSYPEGNSDYASIYRDILKFLKQGKCSNSKFQPLYCLESNRDATENIFSALADNDTYGKNPFRVFLLHKLFFWLKNKCVQVSDEEKNGIGFPVMSNAITELEKDTFCYVTGISCTYHCNIEEKYHNCSLSIVQRYVYVICDHCCQYVNVEIIPGKHCRLPSNVCDSVEDTIMLNNKKEVKLNKKKVKTSKASKIGEICSFYGGSNVPSWTKITSSSLPDEDFSDTVSENLSDCFDNISLSSMSMRKPTFTSITAGRGKVQDLFLSSTYNRDFPPVGRGRRILHEN